MRGLGPGLFGPGYEGFRRCCAISSFMYDSQLLACGTYVCGRRYVLVEEACKRVPAPAVPARQGRWRAGTQAEPSHAQAGACPARRSREVPCKERKEWCACVSDRPLSRSIALARHAARSAAWTTRRVPSAGPSCPKRKAPTSCPAPPLRACRASPAFPASRRHLAPREPPRPLAPRERLACLQLPASRRRQGARARSCGGRSRAASQAARERLRAVRTTRREEERA